MVETPWENPYTSPDDLPERVATLEERERSWEVRQLYQRTEGSISGLMYLCAAGGVLALVNSVAVQMITFVPGTAIEALRFLLSAFMLAVAVYLFVLAFFLSKRSPGARLAAVWMSVFLLLLFPLGTVYGVYALMILTSEQAKTVFTPEHQEILRLTEEKSPFYLGPRAIFLGFCLFALLFFGFGLTEGCTRKIFLRSVMPDMNLMEEIQKANNRPPTPEVRPGEEK